MPHNGRLVESRRPGRNRMVTFEAIEGLGAGLRISVPNGSGLNAYNSFLGRFLYFRDKGTKLYREHITPSSRGIQGFKRICKQFLRSSDMTARPWSPEEVARRSKGHNRAIYFDCVQKWRKMGGEVRKGWSTVYAFCKVEKLPSYEKLMADMLARQISPRAFMLAMLWGMFIGPIEAIIYKRLDRYFKKYFRTVGPVVCKKLNMDQRAKVLRNKWCRFKHPCASKFDADKFDAHVNYMIELLSHSVFRGVLEFGSDYEESEQLFNLLSSMLLEYDIHIDVGDFVLVLNKIRGKRCSGDKHTSLGNVLIVCFGLILVLEKLKSLGIDADVADDGDDFVVVCESCHAEIVSQVVREVFRGLGFEMSLEKCVHEFEHILFCQCQPVFDGVKWLMVRQFPRAYQKDVTLLYELTTPKLFKRYLKALSDGGIAVAGGLPIYQELYLCFARTAGNVIPLKVRNLQNLLEMSRGCARSVSEVNEAARVSFWKAFGVSPSIQILTENYLRNVVIDVSQPTDVLDPVYQHVLGVQPTLLGFRQLPPDW